MKRLQAGIVGVVSVFAIGLFFYWINMRHSCAVNVSNANGQTISEWSYKIGASQPVICSGEINLQSSMLSQAITFSAVGFDEVKVTAAPNRCWLTGLKIKVSRADSGGDDTGTHEGVAELIRDGAPLNYTPLPNTSKVPTGSGHRYAFAGGTAKAETEIKFAKGNIDILSLKIKKKKKNTQVDVYLDEARKWWQF